jgi:hypothetical protein
VPGGLVMDDAVALLADGRTALALVDAVAPRAGETVLVLAAFDLVRLGGRFCSHGMASGAFSPIKDIEFQDGGQVGFAVGTNGVVARSPDGGDSWAAVPGLVGGHPTSANDCSGAGQGTGDVDSVRFAGNARAWLVAGGSQVYRTVDGATAANVGSAALGWEPINDSGASCRITKDIDDLFPVPGSDSVYFISKSFGAVFFSSNALASAATEKPADAGNGFEGVRRVAGNPGNPNRQWAVTSGGEGASYYARTTDGWSTSNGWAIGNPDRGSLTRSEGVDFSGGTVTAVGSAGMIVESIDGSTFYFDPAAGTVATQDWRSVSLAGAADAAVGGTGASSWSRRTRTSSQAPSAGPATSARRRHPRHHCRSR